MTIKDFRGAAMMDHILPSLREKNHPLLAANIQ